MSAQVDPRSLLRLPDEILIQVIDQTSPKDLGNFRDSCKTIRALGCEALALHRTRQRKIYPYQRFFSRDCLHNTKEILDLAEEICIDDRIATYITACSFHDTAGLKLDDSGPQSSSSVLEISPLDREKLLRGLVDHVGRTLHAKLKCTGCFSDKESEQTISRLPEPDGGRFAGILLILISEIDQLDIYALPREPESFLSILDRILRAWKTIDTFSLQRNLLPLGNVRTVTLGDAHDSPLRPSFALLRSFTQLPKLQSLSGSFLHTDQIELPRILLTANSSSVQNLSLNGMNLEANDLIELIRCCKTLKTFCLRTGYDNVSVQRGISDIIAALRENHHVSLEGLALTFDAKPSLFSDAESPSPSPPLLPFTSLTRVDLDIDLFLKLRPQPSKAPEAHEATTDNDIPSSTPVNLAFRPLHHFFPPTLEFFQLRGRLSIPFDLAPLLRNAHCGESDSPLPKLKRVVYSERELPSEVGICSPGNETWMEVKEEMEGREFGVGLMYVRDIYARTEDGG